MMEAVHRYEGTVNKVMGDGIMALFRSAAGARGSRRACVLRGATDAGVGEARTRTECDAPRECSIHIRVGLNSGEVVVRSIGNDLRWTTRRSARRFTSLPDGTDGDAGAIMLAADASRLAEGYVQVTAARSGECERNGGTRRSRMSSRRGGGAYSSTSRDARGLTRFVGRDAEIETLRQSLEHARAGHGQVVAVVGEPGVGKSRLFYEFTHSHRTTTG